MTFSIIMPVYNAEGFLEKSINSVLNQSYTDWELLAINDGSKDNSEKILKKFSGNDSRIKFVTQENAGVSAARNFGIDMAAGDYIIFIDADDELASGALEAINTVIEKENCDMVVYNARRVDCNSNIIGNATEPFSDKPFKISVLHEKAKHIFSLLSSDKSFGFIWNMSIKSTLAKSVKFPVGMAMCEDLLFDIDIYEKAESIVCIPDYLYLYRYSETSCSNSFSYKKVEDLKTAYNAKERIIEKYGITENRNKNLLWFCANMLSIAYQLILNRKASAEFTVFARKDGFITDKFERLKSAGLADSLISLDYIYGSALKREMLRMKKSLRTMAKKLLKKTV